MTGFGIADGFNSFSGDLSSDPSKNLVGSSSSSSIAASLSSGRRLLWGAFLVEVFSIWNLSV